MVRHLLNPLLLSFNLKRLTPKPFKTADGHKERRYDIRRAVEKITSKTGEEKIEFENDGIELRIQDGILVIIDPQFGVNHAGRNELVVYAQNEAKVAHKINELKIWMDLAINTQEYLPRSAPIASYEEVFDKHLLGTKLMEWLNRVARQGPLYRAQLLYLIRGPHQRGLIEEFRSLIKTGFPDEQAGIANRILAGFRDNLILFLMENEINVEVARSFDKSTCSAEYNPEQDTVKVRISEAFLYNSPEIIESNIIKNAAVTLLKNRVGEENYNAKVSPFADELFKDYDSVHNVFIVGDKVMDGLTRLTLSKTRGIAATMGGLVFIRGSYIKGSESQDIREVVEVYLTIWHEHKHREFQKLHGYVRNKEEFVLDELYAEFASLVELFGSEVSDFYKGLVLEIKQRFKYGFIPTLVGDPQGTEEDYDTLKRIVTYQVNLAINIVDMFIRTGRADLIFEYLRNPNVTTLRHLFFILASLPVYVEADMGTINDIPGYSDLRAFYQEFLKKSKFAYPDKEGVLDIIIACRAIPRSATLQKVAARELYSSILRPLAAGEGESRAAREDVLGSEGRPVATWEREGLDVLLGGLADGTYAVAILVPPNFKKSGNLEHQAEAHKEELCDILWHLVNNDSSEAEIVKALSPLWGNRRTGDKGKLIKRLKARLSQLIKYRMVTEFGTGEDRAYSIANQFVSDLSRLHRKGREEVARYLDGHFGAMAETSVEKQLPVHPLVAKAIEEFSSMSKARGYVIPQERFLVDIGMGYFYSKVRKGQKICMVLILGGSFNRNSLNVSERAFKSGGSVMDILLSRNIPAIEIFSSRQLYSQNLQSNLDTGRKVEAYFEYSEHTARKKQPGRLIAKPACRTPATLGKRERTTGTLQVRVLRILAESNSDLTVEEIALELDRQEHGKWVDQKKDYFFMKYASQLSHAMTKCQSEKWVEGKKSDRESLVRPGQKRMAYRITQNGKAHLAEKKYLEDEFIKNQI